MVRIRFPPAESQRTFGSSQDDAVSSCQTKPALRWTEGRDSMKFALGQAVPRTEDPRLLTGRGRYIDDFVLPRLAHAACCARPCARPHPLDRRPCGAADPGCACGADWRGLGDREIRRSPSDHPAATARRLA